ncbi:MAG: hypothetical protein Q8K92_04475 [Leadbetterella sp.]|nr:hypothetical protein [Leadbetterella sp.]
MIACFSNRTPRSVVEKFDFEKELDFYLLNKNIFYPFESEIEKIERKRNLNDLILYKSVGGKPDLNSLLVISIGYNHRINLKEYKTNSNSNQVEFDDDQIIKTLESLNKNKSYMEKLDQYDGSDYFIVIFKEGKQFCNLVSNKLDIVSSYRDVNLLKSILFKVNYK